MQPFAQDQKRSSGRSWLFIAALGAAFSIWFFDLIPRFQPVESGHLVQQTDAHSDVPILPESWDEIVDHTDSSDNSAPAWSADTEHNPLLAAIAESQETDLPDLTEPDVFDVDPIESTELQSVELQEPVEPDPAQSALDLAPPSDNSIQTASFTPELPATDDPPSVESPSAIVPALSTQAGSVLSKTPWDNPPTRPAQQVQPTPREDSRPPRNVIAADVADVIRRADELLAQDEVVRAHGELSRIYWQEPKQRAAFLRRIESTAAQIFTDPHRHFGKPYLVLPGDTFESIARAHDVPWNYLSRLNRISPEDLQAGQEIKVMRGPFHAVVDLSRFELTIQAHGYFVHRYEIGTGENASTPAGDFTVQEKLENPVWYNPDGGVVEADDPDNPLGEYWIGLGDHIGIHGTIDPSSIGTARSRGCIHMRDGDIAEVFDLLGEKSTVRIRP